MPKLVEPKVRNKFDSLVRAGYSIAESRRRAGVSDSWARKRAKQLRETGRDLPADTVAPQIVRYIKEGRTSGEIADLIGIPQHKVQNILKHGTAAAEPEDQIGPIPFAELSPEAKDCLNDFERFRARYLGSLSTPWQIEAGQRAVQHLDSPDKAYTVVNCPQGGGKTRLFSHDLTAWITVRDRSLRGIFGSLSQSVSTGLCANLRDTLERTTPAIARDVDKERGLAVDAVATLADEYGYFKPLTAGGLWRRDSFIVQQHGGASMEKEPTWAAFSREAKFLGWRVDFMVWDDLVNTDMLRNQDRVDDLYRWWDDEAQSRLDPGGLLLLVGQRLRSNDIYRYCLDKRVVVDEFDESDDAEVRPMYHHIMYKAHYDEHCEGNHGQDAEPYPGHDAATRGEAKGKCMLDANRIKWRDIKEKQADGNYEVVYQQEDTDPAEVLVEKAWVYGGIASDGTQHEPVFDTDRSPGQLPRIPPGAYTVRYMTVDPSPTKWWSIQDWLYVLPLSADPMAGFRYLLNMKREKMGANDFLDYSHTKGGFVGLAEEWVTEAREGGHPISYLIMEKNAAQRWAMQYDFFQQWKYARFVQVIPHETTNNKADPELGVWATIPGVWKHGLVRLPGADSAAKAMSHPLVREVTTYPNGATDDCVMSEWFGEYNLQHLVAQRQSGARVTTDIPTWMRER